ncbi:TonB-dependent receptor [Flavobacterium sp. j3]|uniref:TonB-dependent receptor n=1 Tax=Flavobacterium aureirubrum TaxID=3133147 RepID=A0ABU9N1Y6_9FLAO
MKFKLLFILFFVSALGFAQSKGTITGTLTDKDFNNEPLPFANVQVKGLNIGVSTDENGKYTIGLQPGSYIIVFSFVGYENVEEKVEVKAGETMTINKALGSGSYQLKDVVIQNTVSREKETALLLEQKNAVEIKQSIGAQEMSRKGVSDVSGAVTKTTGVTKQEGTGNIFVRGLGDRYNATTINGLPVPSNNPEKKNINLDIFTTDIVESVGIDKVYGSKLYGDFAGGNVDVVSKDYKGKGFVKIDIGSKANTNAVALDEFSLHKGQNITGFSTTSQPNNPLTAYNFETLRLENKTPYAGNLGISAGSSYSIGDEGKLSLFGTANYSNEFNAITDGTAKGSVNGLGVANKDFREFRQNSFTTNTTVMGNAAYKINANHKINFNTIFINTSSQSKEEYEGTIIDIANDDNGLLRRFFYERNQLMINQLLGEHKFGEKFSANWGVSYNTVESDQPDRVQNIFREETNGFVLSNISRPDNHRYFQNITEDEFAARASIDYKFKKNSEGDYLGKITAGYNFRLKNRDLTANQFNFRANQGFEDTVVDPNNLDLFYNQPNFANGAFEITTFRGNYQLAGATRPQSYIGEMFVNAAYLNTEYKFNKLTTVIGLRGEGISQRVSWDTQLGDTGNDRLIKNAFLPSLTMKYELNEKQNLRLGASKTYTLPQFKERALFLYEEVLQVKIGNPDLYESDNYNLDLKWEFFPKSDEVVSFTAFGKYIQNPINEITIASSTNDVSFVNTGNKGYVTGAELEIRKNILSPENGAKISSGLNVSYLHTAQDLDAEKIQRETDYNVAFTNTESAFTGASDLLINADVTYFKEWNDKNTSLTSTLAFTYFSDRINAIGTNGNGNLVDKAVGTLDLVNRFKINRNLGISLIARNLLDPKIERTQENSNGDVKMLSYKKGMMFSLNLTYQF